MSEKWNAKETRVYTGDGGFDIRDLPNATERAAFIVKAVNNHSALVAELRRLFELYGHQATADVLAGVGQPGSGS